MINKNYYNALVKDLTPQPTYLKNAAFAFLFGGSICLTGELLASIFSLYVEEKEAYSLVTVSLILLSAVLTSLGVYDKIARLAGAGTLVPVTGFANAVVSSALDTRAEGYIGGVGTKIFTVAGPVILYSSVAGAFYGLIYYLTVLFT
jgi:stage V sporulation protein AC